MSCFFEPDSREEAPSSAYLLPGTRLQRGPFKHVGLVQKELAPQRPLPTARLRESEPPAFQPSRSSWKNSGRTDRAGQPNPVSSDTCRCISSHCNHPKAQHSKMYNETLNIITRERILEVGCHYTSAHPSERHDEDGRVCRVGKLWI